MSVDCDPARSAEARRLIELAGLSGKVDLHVGDDQEFCRELVARNEHFDIVFLDTNELHYLDNCEVCITLLRPGGLLVVDNALMLNAEDWETSRNVVEDKTGIPQIEVLKALHRKCFADKRLICSVVPIGVGMLLGVKRHSAKK